MHVIRLEEAHYVTVRLVHNVMRLEEAHYVTVKADSQCNACDTTRRGSLCNCKG